MVKLLYLDIMDNHYVGGKGLEPLYCKVQYTDLLKQDGFTDHWCYPPIKNKQDA